MIQKVSRARYCMVRVLSRSFLKRKVSGAVHRFTYRFGIARWGIVYTEHHDFTTRYRTTNLQNSRAFLAEGMGWGKDVLHIPDCKKMYHINHHHRWWIFKALLSLPTDKEAHYLRQFPGISGEYGLKSFLLN